MADKVSIGIVGIGYWGSNLARTFYGLDDAYLDTCVDRDKTQLEKIVSLYPKVNTSTDVADVLDNPAIDAVVISTLAVSHYELAKRALDAGKHTFVEKPLALTMKESEELVSLAKKVDRVLMVGHLLQYHPAVSAIKTLLEGNEIGQISYLYSQRLNLGKIRGDENCLWSLAPHDVSAILYLVGKEPETVSAVGECYLQKGIEDVVFLTLRFSDGVLANIHISWLDPHKVRRLTIVGTKKMIVFDDMESAEKVKVYDKGAGLPLERRSFNQDLTLRFGDIAIPYVECEEPLKMECLHFIDCIRTGKEPLTSGEAGLRIVKVLEATEKSMKNGGCPVSV